MGLFSIFRRRPDKGLTAREKILEALASLHRKGTAEAWGLEVLDEVEKLFPAKHWWQEMTVATLYRNLHQLEDEGVVSARWVKVREGKNLTNRRMYRLTNPPAPV